MPGVGRASPVGKTAPSPHTNSTPNDDHDDAFSKISSGWDLCEEDCARQAGCAQHITPTPSPPPEDRVRKDDHGRRWWAKAGGVVVGTPTPSYGARSSMSVSSVVQGGGGGGGGGWILLDDDASSASSRHPSVASARETPTISTPSPLLLQSPEGTVIATVRDNHVAEVQNGVASPPPQPLMASSLAASLRSVTVQGRSATALRLARRSKSSKSARPHTHSITVTELADEKGHAWSSKNLETQLLERMMEHILQRNCTVRGEAALRGLLELEEAFCTEALQALFALCPKPQKRVGTKIRTTRVAPLVLGSRTLGQQRSTPVHAARPPVGVHRGLAVEEHQGGGALPTSPFTRDEGYAGRRGGGGGTEPVHSIIDRIMSEEVADMKAWQRRVEQVCRHDLCYTYSNKPQENLMCVIDMDAVQASNVHCGTTVLYVIAPVMLLCFFGLMLLRIF